MVKYAAWSSVPHSQAFGKLLAGIVIGPDHPGPQMTNNYQAEVILMVKWKKVAVRIAPAATLVALVATAAASKKWS